MKLSPPEISTTAVASLSAFPNRPPVPGQSGSISIRHHLAIGSAIEGRDMGSSHEAESDDPDADLVLLHVQLLRFPSSSAG